MEMLRNFWNDETGLELSEYAVGAGLIAVAVAVAFSNLGDSIGTRVNGVTDLAENGCNGC